MTTLAQFRESLQPWSPAPEVSQACYDALVNCYGEPHRAYHNLQHIQHALGVAQQGRAEALVLLALWFHDAVYDPHRPDNEAQSAALAMTWLTRLGLPTAALAQVERLIMVTQTHQPHTTAERQMVDADLAILGAPPAQYDHYAQAIRQEYAWVPHEQYRMGRLQVLEQFLQRPCIYHTPTMLARYEQTARHNLQRESLSLTQ